MKNRKILAVITLILFFAMSIMYQPTVEAASTNRIERVDISVSNNGEKPDSSVENIGKPGDKIIITLGFEEVLSSVNSFSNLQIKIKIGANGEEKTLTNQPVSSATNARTFVYTINENDSGILDIVSDSIVIDGDTYAIPETEDVITVDNEAPNPIQFMLVDTEPGKYEEGDQIKVEIIFNEKIYIQQMPSLLIKFGDGRNKSVNGANKENENSIIYEYSIANGDNGELQIIGMSGGLIYDAIGNQTTIDVDFDDISTSIIASTETNNNNTNEDSSNVTEGDSSKVIEEENNTVGDENNSNSSNRNEISGSDNTTSNKILPFTGNSGIIITVGIIFFIIALVSYFSYRKYKDIK